MMDKLNLKYWHYPKDAKTIKTLNQWDIEYNATIEQQVAEIILDVRQNGDKALLYYTQTFDKNPVKRPEMLKCSRDQLAAAWETISPKAREALKLAKTRITRYAEQQKQHGWQFDDEGAILGQRVTPLDSVGLYVPGGTAAYPSSVLMNAIPAKVAGVPRVVMVSPAMSGEYNPLVLASAFLCEVDEFYSIGGAQAIAALAFGTESIAPVDKITGPGNIYVSTAKKQVFGKVAIDMIAGPSEVVVIADHSAPATWVAADLFSQAEHDANAQAILITADKAYAAEVVNAMQDLLSEMPRADIIRRSLEGRGAVIVLEAINQAAEVANLLAPEHLEIMTENPEAIAESITHAGAIFIGRYSCEAFGDYLAGPNHVLPTAGTARFSSPLGVYDFQKRSSVIQLTQEKAAELSAPTTFLAESEGLFAHALSAKLRNE